MSPSVRKTDPSYGSGVTARIHGKREFMLCCLLTPHLAVVVPLNGLSELFFGQVVVRFYVLLLRVLGQALFERLPSCLFAHPRSLPYCLWSVSRDI